MLIERPPKLFRMMFPGALFRLPGNNRREPKSYLTFDDGPHPEVTPMVLDMLDRYDLKATFFMVGQNVERYPRLFDEVKKRGHMIGNHTYSHMKGFGKSTKEYVEDVEKGAMITGSKLFRPPHGLMTPSQFLALRKRYNIVMYDIVTRDYSSRLNSEQVFDNVIKYLRDGSIIVFHDSLKSLPRLKETLPQALDWILGEGFDSYFLPESKL